MITNALFVTLSVCGNNLFVIENKCRQNFKQVVFDDEEEDLCKKVNGMTMSEYMETDPAFKVLFQNAMSDLSTIHMRQVIDTYTGFEGVSTLVDVSGGTGKGLRMIISRYHSIKGINIDLPQVIQHAPSLPGKKLKRI